MRTTKAPRCEKSTLRTKTRLPFNETWSDKEDGGGGLYLGAYGESIRRCLLYLWPGLGGQICAGNTDSLVD